MFRRAVEAVGRLRGGYPGGFRSLAAGWRTGQAREGFRPCTDPADLRSRIPVGGLREYWYPALPEAGVSARRPEALRILGVDVVLFRDGQGVVRALHDVCPHRGVRLSKGSCYWKGFLTCNYHGATFDGQGECVEMIPEGPDSRMVGVLRARPVPTFTAKGVVFVWIGDGEPVDPREDLPPEFFEDSTLTKYAWTYWKCNWMVAWENTLDAHNQFFVHRDSVRMLLRSSGGRLRTPLGPRAKVLGGTTLHPERRADGTLEAAARGKSPTSYYAGEDGKVPYQMYYPRVQGWWPKYRTRRLWTWASERIAEQRRRMTPVYEIGDEWLGQRLPGLVRHRHWDTLYTRWSIPVEDDLTRVFYMLSARPRTRVGRIWQHVRYPVYNWAVHFNFSNQDYGAMESTRYSEPEHLSATDSYMVGLRRLVVEHARKPRHHAEPDSSGNPVTADT